MGKLDSAAVAHTHTQTPEVTFPASFPVLSSICGNPPRKQCISDKCTVAPLFTNAGGPRALSAKLFYTAAVLANVRTRSIF